MDKQIIHTNQIFIYCSSKMHQPNKASNSLISKYNKWKSLSEILWTILSRMRLILELVFVTIICNISSVEKCFHTSTSPWIALTAFCAGSVVLSTILHGLHLLEGLFHVGAITSSLRWVVQVIFFPFSFTASFWYTSNVSCWKGNFWKFISSNTALRFSNSSFLRSSLDGSINSMTFSWSLSPSMESRRSSLRILSAKCS